MAIGRSGAPRVIVTGAEHRAVLGAERALARAGYRVCAVAAQRPAPGHWSRACSWRALLADPLRAPQRFAEQLAQLARAGGFAALLPGSDASLLALARHRSLLARAPRLRPPPALEDVERALDKLALADAARAAGLDCPAGELCATAADAAAAARRLGYPVIVKPRRSVVGEGERAAAVGALAVEAPGALAGALATAGLPCLVQRRLAAPAYSLAAVATPRGLPVVAFARYSRTWPEGAGNAAFAETLTPPAWLVGAARELAATLRWQGLFELELLARDDCGFAAIDFNPRPYGSLALALRAGANLPAAWCEWALGGDPAPAVARPGFRYRWEDADARQLARCLRHRRPAAAAAIALPRRRTAHAYFALRDPAPIAARALQLGRAAARRVGAPR